MEKKQAAQSTPQDQLVSQFQYEIASSIPVDQGRKFLEQYSWNVNEALMQYYTYYLGTGKIPSAGNSFAKKPTKKSKNIIFFSNTRAGKSTLVNVLSNKQAAAVGTSSYGKSTTLTYTSYNFTHLNQAYTAYDGPGLNDSECRVSNKDIKKQILQIMIEGFQGADLQGLLFFQSCATDHFMMNVYLEKAVAIFGPEIKKTIVVLLTKYKKADPGLVQEAKKTCEEIGLKFLEWESIDITPEEMEQQKRTLFETISTLTPFQMKDVLKYRRDIVEQAFSLKSQAPDLVKEEVEEYKDTVQDIKFVKENLNVKIPYTYEKPRGGLAGLFGGTKTVSTQVEANIPIEKPVITDVEVTKKYQKKTQVKPPLDQFIEPARKVILKRIGNNM
ncbi:hypothetical protein FGO68_gene13768 [Halteria grandinella]|uniref:G domain-containing protein n=1 Tax=Halteria grandinella TaxID=5974 RepID=A0A8J8NWG1_HALGN|nr:hypothetical protein FGO68_gene13768 [Halteria grandinella]